MKYFVLLALLLPTQVFAEEQTVTTEKLADGRLNVVTHGPAAEAIFNSLSVPSEGEIQSGGGLLRKVGATVKCYLLVGDWHPYSSYSCATTYDAAGLAAPGQVLLEDYMWESISSRP